MESIKKYVDTVFNKAENCIILAENKGSLAVAVKGCGKDLMPMLLIFFSQYPELRDLIKKDSIFKILKDVDFFRKN